MNVKQKLCIKLFHISNRKTKHQSTSR